jgi:hypothetical protein
VAGVGREQFVGQNRVFCVREVFWLIGSIAATRRTTKWGIRSRPLNVIRDTWNAGSHPRLASGVPAGSEIAYHSKLVGGIRGNPGLVVARCSMNSNWAPLFVAGSLLVLTTDIAAQEQAVLGQGNVSCGSWLNDRKGDDTDASSRIAWVLGYVTAFNQYESKPAGDVSGAKGTEEIMAWIDNYCGHTPAIISIGRQLRSSMNSDISSDASSDYGQYRVAYCRFRQHHPPSHPSPKDRSILHKNTSSREARL